jgi:hypothetical protein
VGIFYYFAVWVGNKTGVEVKLISVIAPLHMVATEKSLSMPGIESQLFG